MIRQFIELQELRLFEGFVNREAELFYILFAKFKWGRIERKKFLWKFERLM